jgi:hypothetical protein
MEEMIEISKSDLLLAFREWDKAATEGKWAPDNSPEAASSKAAYFFDLLKKGTNQ